MKGFFEVCKRATTESACYDIPCPSDITLGRDWQTIDLGVALTDDDWDQIHGMHGNGLFAILIFPRSGLAARSKYRLANSVAVIDMDYRSEILATVMAEEEVHLKEGDRFLQAMIVPVVTAPHEVPPTSKREGGYGSTGL